MRGRLLVVGLSALLLGAVAMLRAERASWAFVVPELIKLGPGVVPPRLSRIDLAAARGECVGAQLVAPAPVAELTAQASPLATADGAALPVALYREVFVELKQASNIEGKPGPWPDPLIPDVDAYAHERRNAFPASSSGPQPVALYVEICVPVAASPGLYSGAISLRSKDRPQLAIPVHVRVRRFALPQTSSLPTSFGFSGISAASGHGLPVDDEHVQALTRLYAIAALRHRISLHGLSMEPPPILADDPMRLDFSAFDAEVGPLLDGTALPGARFTSIDVRLHPKAKTGAQKLAYLHAFAEHLAQKGWLDRAFVYLKDEPAPSDLPAVRLDADLVHRADPRLRALVTSSLAPQLAGAIDLWTPNVNCLVSRPGDDYCRLAGPPADYAGERSRGAKLWWYQSCGSHGCGPVGAHDLPHLAYFSGWPSYMIDCDAALNRAMGALAFRYGIEGELYFNTVEAYGGDPWKDVWRFHGNGDGTLFYPGTPARIGGSAHVPIESLRLKHLRAGLQDYEYLALARALNLGKDADEAAQELTPRAYEIARDPQLWQRVRERLAARIELALEAAPEYRQEGGVQAKDRR